VPATIMVHCTGHFSMPEHKFDVLCFGEMLIDFVPTVSGASLIEADSYKKAPGGAPANVAVGLSRLGILSGFMGMVGDDPFGHFLVQILKENNVNVECVHYSKKARTGLAFVSLQKNGERDFLFYRNPSADMLYSPEEIDIEAIQSSKIFHFGSISLIDEPVRSATLKAIEIARQANCLISYDPNIRLNLWPNIDAAWNGIMLVWDLVNIIKVSDEELYFLTNETDIKKGVQKLWHAGIRLMVVTCGAHGAYCATSKGIFSVPGFSVKAVDTTGAGDGFVAGLLAGLVHASADLEDEKELYKICQRANAVGALTTTKRGAIPALPTLDQIEKFLKKNLTGKL